MLSGLLSIFLIVVTSSSISSYNENYFYRRTDALDSEKVSENIFKVTFPFLGGSTVFEKTIERFNSVYPDKKINHIYTVPNPLRLKKADALIFYIITEDKK